eukprot:236794-Chlamydomonas_euryale.AAC.10
MRHWMTSHGREIPPALGSCTDVPSVILERHWDRWHMCARFCLAANTRHESIHTTGCGHRKRTTDAIPGRLMPLAGRVSRGGTEGSRLYETCLKSIHPSGIHPSIQLHTNVSWTCT